MTIRRLTWLVAGIALAGLLAAGARYTRRAGERLTRGSASRIQFIKNPVPVPQLALRDLDGHAISTANWRSKVTLVNFWATWCPPCREEVPDLVALQSKYPDRLQVIGISIDEASPDHVREFTRRYRVNYPIAMATREVRAAFGGVPAVPTTYVVDPAGMMVQKHVGLISPDVYDQEIRALLSLPVDATVELVEDTGKVFLANAAHATEIPGLDLSALTGSQRTAVLQRLNADRCTCGCDLTLAQCRINDPDCDVSLPLAQQLLSSMVK